mmetsp:Transcript_36266/g.84736  ORF Transcript_36266/g.84736 Transcript_36266/m.84736 type:complete len:407 (-) Transcript_36266:806-2026(-)
MPVTSGSRWHGPLSVRLGSYSLLIRPRGLRPYTPQMGAVCRLCQRVGVGRRLDNMSCGEPERSSSSDSSSESGSIEVCLGRRWLGLEAASCRLGSSDPVSCDGDAPQLQEEAHAEEAHAAGRGLLQSGRGIRAVCARSMAADSRGAGLEGRRPDGELPVTHGCCTTCSEVSRIGGSSCSSPVTNALAASDTKEPFSGRGGKSQPRFIRASRREAAGAAGDAAAGGRWHTELSASSSFSSFKAVASLSRRSSPRCSSSSTDAHRMRCSRCRSSSLADDATLRPLPERGGGGRGSSRSGAISRRHRPSILPSGAPAIGEEPRSADACGMALASSRTVVSLGECSTGDAGPAMGIAMGMGDELEKRPFALGDAEPLGVRMPFAPCSKGGLPQRSTKVMMPSAHRSTAKS